MAYAVITDLPADIETTEQLRTDAVNAFAGVIDAKVGVYYETPVDFDDFDSSDQKTELQARFKRWNLTGAAGYLTAQRPGASEKVLEQFNATMTELDRIRDGFERLPLLTEVEAPVRARAW
jgi:hypothetical protein